MADRYVSVPMTLNDLYPGFQGHFKVTVYLEVEYIKKVRLTDKVTVEH